MSRKHIGGGGRGWVWGEVPQARELKNRNVKSWGVETGHWTCPGWRLFHISTAPQTHEEPFMEVPAAHPAHPTKGGCQRKMKGSQAQQGECHLALWCSDLLMFLIKEKQNRSEVGLFLFFLLLCAVHIETRYLELGLSQHPLPDAGQTGPIIAQIPADFVQIFSSQQQTPALTLNLYSQPLAWSPAWGCQLCPTRAGNFPTPHGNFCGEIFLFFLVSLALKGSETLQWWWGDTKSHFVVWGLQLPLVSWVFLGSWWEALGMWQRRDQGEDSPECICDQTDRHTPSTVPIYVSLPKYQTFSYKWANISL